MELATPHHRCVVGGRAVFSPRASATERLIAEVPSPKSADLRRVLQGRGVVERQEMASLHPGSDDAEFSHAELKR